MSRNSKNARLKKLASEQPKNRSAAAKERRASGKVNSGGRAAAPKHEKKNAWWQKGTYSEYVKGKAKGRKRSETSDASPESE